MPFLIGISGGFKMYIYAIIQHRTMILHTTRVFQGCSLHIMQFQKSFNYFCIFMQNERIVSRGMILYNQFKGTDLNGGVKAHI